MARIAIVGSGVAGLLAAHGLRRGGHEVTVYSDRSGAQLVAEARPTGVAARFGRALSYDRELGLAFWDDHPARTDGVALVLCPKPGNQLITLRGRFALPSLAIDVRRLSERWMAELERRGGRVVVGAVDVAALDEIAGRHDLTVVAAGRADLSRIFELDPARSVYERPQRNLCMVLARGRGMTYGDLPFVPVCINIIFSDGETIWVPFVHQDGTPVWALVFEGRPGGRIDRFGGVRTGEEALATAKEVVREVVPWDAAWVDAMTLADPNGWLTGAVTPAVRRPVARLPSGRVVTGLGDTLMAMDPVGAQGANNGTRMARHLVSTIGARPDGPFDAAWMEETFEAFWQAEGRQAVDLTNMFLEPMPAAGQMLMMCQQGSDGVTSSATQRVANLFCNNFEDPRTLTPILRSDAEARRVLRQAGGSYPGSMLRGMAKVTWGQLRQALGMRAAHPFGVPRA
ncbi:MAG TPA: styrene monooxygenase/indole monooxygenase family protein [Myxococcales bacterium]|nr:styrene monooxygenase/indole monooxygenase family protein [Myxococcales bacterium]